MKKITLISFLMSFSVIVLYAQNIELQGKAKITEMDTVTDNSANVVRQADGTLALRNYKIGDLAQGGIVFYVDESGEHGLVSDTVDLIVITRWYAGTFGNTRATGDGPYSGEMNTAIIMAAHVSIGDDGNPYAARLCANLNKGGFGDWYLPSKEELSLMHTNLNLAGLGSFPNHTYWSSTESSNTSAWTYNFTDGSQNTFNKNFEVCAVRPIRAF